MPPPRRPAEPGDEPPVEERSDPTTWERVAEWYLAWAGESGSGYHLTLAQPLAMGLLDLQPGERLLDVGCGHGVLAQHVLEAGARYTGVDSSRRLIAAARQTYGRAATFVVGDARSLQALREVPDAAFDAAVFLLSVQDMDPLMDVISSAAQALRVGGRMVLVMNHPCFRIPRQSGWEWDEARTYQVRRIDRYLTPLAIPMRAPGDRETAFVRHYHHPLQDYVTALATNGLAITALEELPTRKEPPPGRRAAAERLAHREIPLFLGIRADKFV